MLRMIEDRLLLEIQSKYKTLDRKLNHLSQQQTKTPQQNHSFYPRVTNTTDIVYLQHLGPCVSGSRFETLYCWIQGFAGVLSPMAMSPSVLLPPSSVVVPPSVVLIRCTMKSRPVKVRFIRVLHVLNPHIITSVPIRPITPRIVLGSPVPFVRFWVLVFIAGFQRV